jgi:hypothetical protein
MTLYISSGGGYLNPRSFGPETDEVTNEPHSQGTYESNSKTNEFNYVSSIRVICYIQNTYSNKEFVN